jgi:cytoskeleton protein RodZ
MTIVERLPSHDLGAKCDVGDRLKSEREARGLSLEDVSQTLKVSRRVLEQIEANAWGELPGYTFARGIVRAYAKLLAVEAQPLLAELDAAPLLKRPLLELPTPTRAALPLQGQSRTREKFSILAGVFLVGISVMVYLFVPNNWFNESAGVIAPVPTDPSIGVPPQQATLLEPSSVIAKEMSSGVIAEKMVPSVVAVAVPVILPMPDVGAPLSTAVAGNPTLVMSFIENSWVEVKDKNGVMLLSENVPAGVERSLSGSGPISLALGNAEGVRVTYRGQLVDLKPHTRQKVARLSLD